METGIYLAPFTAMHLSGTQETLHSVLCPESKIPHLQRKGTPCLQPQPRAQVHRETSEGDSTAYADPTLSSRVSLPTIPPHCLAPQGHIPKKEALACPLHNPVSQEWLLSVGSLVFLFLHSELSWPKCLPTPSSDLPTPTCFKHRSDKQIKALGTCLFAYWENLCPASAKVRLTPKL